MIVMGSLLTRVFATCGLAGFLSLALGPQGAQATDANWTLSLQPATRNVHVMAGVVRALERERGRVTVSVSRGTLRIAGPPSEIDRLAHVMREIDDSSTAGLRIWTVRVRQPSEMARKLDEMSFDNRRWHDGVKISKVIPDDVGGRLIVVADEAGYMYILGMRLNGCP